MLLSRKTDTDPASQTGCHLAHLRAIAQMAWLVYSADCSLRQTIGIENFRHFIFFWHPHISSYAVHVTFPLFLGYLNTQLYILSLIPKLTGQTKVNMSQKSAPPRASKLVSVHLLYDMIEQHSSHTHTHTHTHNYILIYIDQSIHWFI